MTWLRQIIVTVCAIATFKYWVWLGISEPLAVVGSIVIWLQPNK